MREMLSRQFIPIRPLPLLILKRALPAQRVRHAVRNKVCQSVRHTVRHRVRHPVCHTVCHKVSHTVRLVVTLHNNFSRADPLQAYPTVDDYLIISSVIEHGHTKYSPT